MDLVLSLLPLAALADLLNTAMVIGITALALGFVIFVHELGHFAVAKLCGVRCDKFFIGFDVGGYKISRKIGETEYGIGALPLGGYVKMFGQDDNVANLADQIEQSKQLEGSPHAKQITGPGGEKLWVDRRSYLAKSVPQRMAIISAGVIMNVIFAFLFAWIAYGVGVPETPAVVGSATPGGAAWEAGLRTGDRIIDLAGQPNPTYRQLQQAVILADLEAGLPMRVKRADGAVEDFVVKPNIVGLAPMIQVASSVTAEVAQRGDSTTRPFTPAEGTDFQAGDLITAINAEPVASYADIARLSRLNKSEPLTYTLQRVKGDTTESVSVSLPPNPMEGLGVVLTLGPVSAVQADSPAAAAGFKVGDQIVAIDGVRLAGFEEEEGALSDSDTEAALDPLTLDDRLAPAAAAQQSVAVTLQRDGETAPVTLSVIPRPVTWEGAPGGETPASIEALGVACSLSPTIAAVVPGSPAAREGIAPGAELLKATLVGFGKSEAKKTQAPQRISIELSGGKQAWPEVLWALQDQGPDFRVELQMATGEGDATRTVSLKPESVEDAYWSPRGIELEQLSETRRTDSWAERSKLAYNETLSQLSGIFRLLQKLGSQVSVKALGGPVMIAKVTGQSAFEGWGPLLMTLTMFSANLAVINFLPIPVLDGGHMLFLAYEGLTGKPANERIMVALHVAGLVFLLGLMAMVFTLDISRLLGIAL
ncbi:site-2 protease family protein [Botrimarina hoheduenensis]|uniref:Putative zinc metalloprotease n=1 Tax=Botrimarina hoheduenensis TaxID=2528000 RepID=A0A5C5WB41_9BACT|nr:site-2 protease family protein [Botrimarina hoheduenensis]TWT47231.1 putative zinc metalloprotease [Botrimarina hoheduenensis]